MKIQIDHINLSVINLTASESFYSQTFGFEKVESGHSISNSERRPWSILKKDASMLCLYENPKLKTSTDKDDGFAKIYHFGIRLEGIQTQEWEEKIAHEKIPIEDGEAVQYPHSTSWYVIDPSGHKIEVSYWPQGVKF